MTLRTLILALAVALPAQAHEEHAHPEGSPSSQPRPLYSLPDREDVVSWRLLAQVAPMKMEERILPQYSDAVLALDRKTVKVQGFMLPLKAGDEQTHFFLSAVPPAVLLDLHAGGADRVVEVRTTKPVPFTWDAVIMIGKLSVLKEDPDGILYRLTEATEAK